MNSAPLDVRLQAIAYGRSLVRAIQALAAVAEHTGGFGWIEATAHKVCLVAYRHSLQRLVAKLPEEVTAQILAAR